jgi:hypothetical protein
MGPELQFTVRALVTASMSCSRPLANDAMPGRGGGAGGVDPLREVLAGEAGDHGGERADLAGCGLELGAAVQDRLEAGLLVLGRGVGAAAEPVRDVADGGRGRGQPLPG